MKKFLIIAFSFSGLITSKAQTPNTSPLPTGETVIGNHLHVGQANEIWTDASALYFNYRGMGAVTHFWNLGGGTGKSILTLLNTGKVGIGTVAPSSNLHVVATNPEISTFQYSGDANYPRLNIIGSPTKINLALGASQTNGTDLSFSTTQINDALIIKGDGNIGIGTTSPDAKLEVVGKSISGLRLNGTSGELEALSIYNTTAANLPSGNSAVIQFYNNSNNYNYLLGASIKSISSNNQYGWESDLYLRTTKNNGYSNQTILDALVIKGNTGNVGIGTSSPDAKFHLVGGYGRIENPNESSIQYKATTPGQFWDVGTNGYGYYIIYMKLIHRPMIL